MRQLGCQWFFHRRWHLGEDLAQRSRVLGKIPYHHHRRYGSNVLEYQHVLAKNILFFVVGYNEKNLLGKQHQLQLDQNRIERRIL